MASEYGKNLKVSVFGQSHGKAIGVNIDGLPAGETIDEEKLYRFIQRRAPGQNKTSTARKEKDKPVFLSGFEHGKTCGFPLCAIIENADMHSSDYESLKNKPRPGHADYTAYVKYGGTADMRGGGHFSGRLTAPLCIAGGIALQILEKHGIYIGAHVLSIADKQDDAFPLKPQKELFETIAKKDFPAINDAAAKEMEETILAAKAELDSVGGVVECAVTGLPAGLGGVMFDGIEGRLASAIFGIPAVKGVEFGLGFDATKIKGSQNNDAFIINGEKVETETNNCGGILGGISNGMPIVFKTAFKPTPSIAQKQKTVDLEKMENTTVEITGRHDPCVVLRAVPVVEAVAAIVILDMIME
ncbi:MAG: chorismate synthase [Clostridia bacterium]|nr:chorismate synthase [Clostridia bacterium]